MPKRKPKVRQRILTTIPIGVGQHSFIYKSDRSPYWQYRHWIPAEKKRLRISLHTSDLEHAKQLAEKKFLEIVGVIASGASLFTITAEEQVRRFLQLQEERYKNHLLSYSRLYRYRNVTNHYLKFVGRETRLDRIPSSRFKDYLSFRKSVPPIPKFTTIREEQITIGSLFKWSREQHLVSASMIPQFSEFKVPQHENRRQGIDEKIYNKIIRVTKDWHKHGQTERDKYERRILHCGIMAMGWFGFRTGEMLKLEWRDVQFRNDGTCVVTLRSEITKTGRPRTNVGRADIFKRVKEFSIKTNPTDRIFSSFAPNAIYNTDKIYFYRRWQELHQVLKEKFPEFDKRIDPYVMRHFYITTRLLAEESPYEVSLIAGNRLRQIETHYAHVPEKLVAEKFLRKKVRFNSDGTVTVTEVKQEGAKQ